MPVIPTVWWRKYSTYRCSFDWSEKAPTLIASEIVFGLPPMRLFAAVFAGFSPHPAAPAQLGSMSSVELVIAFPEVVTFHMPTDRCAVPRAGLSLSMNLTPKVHVPAGKLTPPSPSTIQPLPFGVVSGPGSVADGVSSGADWPGEKSWYSAGGAGLLTATRLCVSGKVGCAEAVALSMPSVYVEMLLFVSVATRLK